MILKQHTKLKRLINNKTEFKKLEIVKDAY